MYKAGLILFLIITTKSNLVVRTPLLYYLLLLVFMPVSADRILIPLDLDGYAEEKSQNAIIAWNGEKEVLILYTNLVGKGRFLEVIPLPSKPEVKKGDLDSFRKVVKIAKKNIWIPSMGGWGRKKGER
ncbi:hypothetical protein DRO97_01250 [Archaeoglobales archaeon]|nr:MAG: hypothetical protein DRO97_01250 [Archaeoglobales archaeon]